MADSKQEEAHKKKTTNNQTKISKRDWTCNNNMENKLVNHNKIT